MHRSSSCARYISYSSKPFAAKIQTTTCASSAHALVWNSSKSRTRGVEDTDGGKRGAIRTELEREGIYKSVDLENKFIEVEN